MIKNITLIIAIFLIASVSQAQLFRAYKAKDGYAAALAEAQKTIPSGPQLIFVGTTKQTVNIIVDINIDFNLNDGTSLGWFYLFKDKTNDSNSVALIVVRPIIGNYTTYPISASSILNSGLPFNPKRTLDEFAWLNSDSFASKLKSDSEFMSFYNAHKDSAQLAIALFTNADWQILESNQPYWGVIMTDKSAQKACGMHAVNGELRCGVLSVAEDLQKIGVNVYPNPASNSVNINIPNEITYFGEIEIYDSNSILISSQTLITNFGLISLNVDNFSSGFYFAKMNTSRGVLTIPFVISK